jgi:hypothetical protein
VEQDGVSVNEAADAEEGDASYTVGDYGERVWCASVPCQRRDTVMTLHDGEAVVIMKRMSRGRLRKRNG